MEAVNANLSELESFVRAIGLGFITPNPRRLLAKEDIPSGFVSDAAFDLTTRATGKVANE